MVSYDDDDEHSLAVMGWKEARGQGLIGMRAAMWVAVNRTGAPDFPSTLHDVIYQKNAYSSMSRPSDPEFNLEPSGMSWDQALVIAKAVLEQSMPDPTHGARYYANLRTMDQDGWFARNIAGRPDLHPHLATIGAHDFYA